MQADYVFSYAPGKAILVGEHAVVYGARAIAVPIENGVRVAITKAEEEIRKRGIGPLLRGVGALMLGEVFIGDECSGPKQLIEALQYLVDAFGSKVKDIAIIVDGSLPPGRGLGSSAALSVGIIKGIGRYLSLPISEKELFAHANALETIFHGRPSGIDHTVVIGGETIGFQRKLLNEQVSWPIKLKCELKLVIGLVGPHDGTKNAVNMLSERRKRHEQIYERIFSGLNDIAIDMEKYLIEGSLAAVGELMNIAHGYLSALMVSTAELDKLCALARERGALGAKLTGAGGGGAVIALADNNEKELLSVFRAAGYHSFVTVVKNDK